jgi:hypothetical protein
MVKLKGTSYDDNLVRDFVVEFCDNMWGVKLIKNEELYKIDLLGVEDPTLGVEVEHGKWEGNFWENDTYSLISEQSFRTINIPARKEKYWQEEYFQNRKTRHNLSHDKNIFIRTNKDFTQVIVIRPETIKNPKKLVRTKFQPKNSNEIENWLSFRKSDVETYDLINGEFRLQKIEEENIIKKLWDTIIHLLK